MSSDAADRVRRFLDARDGYFPIDVLAVVTRTGDRLLASDLRTLLVEVDQAWADVHNRAKVEMLSGAVWTCPDCEGEFPASCAFFKSDPEALADAHEEGWRAGRGSERTNTRAIEERLAAVQALADEWDHDITELRDGARRNGDVAADWHADARQQHLRQLRAALDTECATCSGRGVWMDEPCGDCKGEVS